mmetsp:Transcript_88465/g.258553  ORF Transcript_88465/g.258553 Transcript_88465/m.258553 type:complete len:358 (+) Transcript_88465:914-1987(+)
MNWISCSTRSSFDIFHWPTLVGTPRARLSACTVSWGMAAQTKAWRRRVFRSSFWMTPSKGTFRCMQLRLRSFTEAASQRRAVRRSSRSASVSVHHSTARPDFLHASRSSSSSLAGSVSPPVPASSHSSSPGRGGVPPVPPVTTETRDRSSGPNTGGALAWTSSSGSEGISGKSSHHPTRVGFGASSEASSAACATGLGGLGGSSALAAASSAASAATSGSALTCPAGSSTSPSRTPSIETSTSTSGADWARAGTSGPSGSGEHSGGALTSGSSAASASLPRPSCVSAVSAPGAGSSPAPGQGPAAGFPAKSSAHAPRSASSGSAGAPAAGRKGRGASAPRPRRLWTSGRRSPTVEPG